MRRAAAVALAVALPALHAAAGEGIATRGVTGGLTIPSADVLPSGAVGYSFGNFEESRTGPHPTVRNHTLGIGLVPNVEIFGRFADFEDPAPGSRFIGNGTRDISANVKLKLPRYFRSQPDIAVGLNDIGGGVRLFGAVYVVASDSLGFADWTLGYARGSTIPNNPSGAKNFNGVFGGVQLRAWETGISAIAEYDGQAKYAGLRYRSPSVPMLGGTHFVLSLQRSFGAKDGAGRPADATSAQVSAIVPLEGIAERPRTFKPEHALRSLDAPSPAMGATADDRMAMLQKQLAQAGLERVRVGLQDRDLVVEYENHVFGQTEADAVGVVLGLVAELAPAGTARVRAVTLKAGLPVYVTSVSAAEYRGFLRTGDSNYVGGNLAVDLAASHHADTVRWASAPARRNWVHFQLEPELTNTIGTELGVFDYSFAGVLKTHVPVWRGAEVYASYVQRIANTELFEPGFFFGQFRHRTGLRAVALQQSVWVGSRVLVTAGVGRYRYEDFGVDIEATAFVPGRADVLRLKAAAYQRQPTETRAQAMPASATYRWVPAPHTWVEAGFQQFTDGTRGPSFVLTRWFGEVGANVFVRRGGTRTFAGLELTIPLTPRRGADFAGATFNGTQQFTKGARTRIVTQGGTNTVDMDKVRDFPSEYDAELRLLNGGHVSEKYFIARLHRMREAFYVYARDALPE